MNDEQKKDLGYEPMPSFEDDPNFNSLLGLDQKQGSPDVIPVPDPEEDAFTATKRMDFNKDLPRDLSMEQVDYRQDELRVRPRTAARRAESQSNRKDGKNGKKSKKKLSGAMVNLIWIGGTVLVAILIAILAIVLLRDAYGLGKGDMNNPREIECYIEQGSTLYDVIDMLHEEDIIQNTLVFKAFVKLSKVDTTIQYGLHTFRDTMGYSDILATLREQTAFKETVTVTVKEGSTLDEIAALLAEKGVVESASKFKDALIDHIVTSDLLRAEPDDRNIHYDFEGYLFPDTYNFFLNSTPDMPAKTMLERMEEKYTEQMRTDTWNMGWSTHQVLTLASIVEKETRGCEMEQKEKVAAVFLNRLNWQNQPHYLGSTPTISYANQYGALYNTNADGGYEGLPPGPICSPSVESIKAVIYAKKNFDYYYFVTDKNGQFYFTKSYKEHESVIARLKKQGLWA